MPPAGWIRISRRMLFGYRTTDWSYPITRFSVRNAQLVGHDRIAQPKHGLIISATNLPSDIRFRLVGTVIIGLWLVDRRSANTVHLAEPLVYELGHKRSATQVRQP